MERQVEWNEGKREEGNEWKMVESNGGMVSGAGRGGASGHRGEDRGGEVLADSPLPSLRAPACPAHTHCPSCARRSYRLASKCS